MTTDVTSSWEVVEHSSGPKRKGRAAAWLTSDRGRESYTAIAFVSIFAIYAAWLGSKFTDVNQRMFDVHGNTPLLILALSVLITLIAGHFDLSAASLCSLVTFLTVGLRAVQHWPFAAVLVVVLVVGVAAGLINGLLVTKLHVNAFIATLGTGGLFTGAASVYSGGNAISPSPSDVQLPAWFLRAGQYDHKAAWWILVIFALGALALIFTTLRDRRPLKVSSKTWHAFVALFTAVCAVVCAVVILTWGKKLSVTVLILLGVAAVMWALLRYTVYGRYVTATGYNREAAALAGVKTDRITLTAFVIGGVLASLSGIFLASNLGSAQPGVGTEFLLPAFAAAFLSTVILSPGRFTVWGTILGGVFVIWISQGLVIGGVKFTWTSIVQGLALVVTVSLSTIFRRRS